MIFCALLDVMLTRLTDDADDDEPGHALMRAGESTLYGFIMALD